MKNIGKRILAIVLVCLMLVSVVACAADPLPTTPADTTKKPQKPGNQTTTPKDTEPEDDTPEEVDYWIDLAVDGTPKYVVICTDTRYQSIAEEFADLLWLKSDVEFSFSDKDVAGSTKKIYVGGKVSDALSDISELSYRGELAIDVGGNIHITGHCIETIESSARRFANNIKASYIEKDEEKGNSVKIPNTVFFLDNPDNYFVKDAKLLSENLADYRIVISATDGAMTRMLVGDLIDGIGKDTGVLLRSYKDTTAAVEKEIVFGSTARGSSKALTDALANDSYAIKSDGKRIYIVYENYVAALDAIEKFRTLYVTNQESIDVTAISETSVSEMIHKQDESHIRIFTTNVMAAGHVKGVNEINKKYGVTYKDRAQIQAAMLLDYLPDFIGMQEMQESPNVNGYEGYQHTEFKNALKDEYSMVTYHNVPASEYWTPIMYRSTVWEMVDGEAFEYNGNNMHRVQWALFRKIDDPTVQYALINTHYSSQSLEKQLEGAEIINGLFFDLKSWYGEDLMISVTGDFNTAYKTKTFNTTTQGTTWDSSHALTSNKGSAVSPLDYILVDSSVANVEGYRLISNGHIYMSSDHKPVVADVSPKVK